MGTQADILWIWGYDIILSGCSCRLYMGMRGLQQKISRIDLVIPIRINLLYCYEYYISLAPIISPTFWLRPCPQITPLTSLLDPRTLICWLGYFLVDGLGTWFLYYWEGWSFYGCWLGIFMGGLLWRVGLIWGWDCFGLVPRILGKYFSKYLN